MVMKRHSLKDCLLFYPHIILLLRSVAMDTNIKCQEKHVYLFVSLTVEPEPRHQIAVTRTQMVKRKLSLADIVPRCKSTVSII